MKNLQVIVTLGGMAHSTLLNVFSRQLDRKINIPFKHAGVGFLQNGLILISSYHPSRQNTQTGKLTMSMFDEVWGSVKNYIH